MLTQTQIFGGHQTVAVTWIVSGGVTVGILSSALQAYGLALQKRAAAQVVAPVVPTTSSQVNVRKPLYRDRRWLLGLSLFVFCNIIGSFVAVATVPLVILSLLQSCSLLFNSVIARYMLGGKFFRDTMISSGLMIIGGIVIGRVGLEACSTSKLTYSIDELIRMVRTSSAFANWILFTNITVVVALLMNYVVIPRTRPMIKGVLYGISSGVLSGHSLLLVKLIVMIFERCIITHSQKKFSDLTRFSFFILIVSFVFYSLAQLYLLNRALRYINASILFPLIICIYNLSSIFNSILLFTDDDAHSVIWKISPGIYLLIAGISYFSYDQYKHPVVADAENGLESNRTTALSYASLRPLSMDSSASLANETLLDLRNPIIVEESEGEANYVSFHQRNNSDFGMATPKKNRQLSYEQEELLAQLT